MNWRVSADLPTPPLPTMITLCTTGWAALAVFEAILLAAFVDRLALRSSPSASSNRARCSRVQQRCAALFFTSSWLCFVALAGCFFLGSVVLAPADVDGQAKVKIFESVESARHSCTACTTEMRTELGHCLTALRIESQFARTFERILVEEKTNDGQKKPLECKLRVSDVLTRKRPTSLTGADGLTVTLLFPSPLSGAHLRGGLPRGERRAATPR